MDDLEAMPAAFRFLPFLQSRLHPGKCQPSITFGGAELVALVLWSAYSSLGGEGGLGFCSFGLSASGGIPGLGRELDLG